MSSVGFWHPSSSTTANQVMGPALGQCRQIISCVSTPGRTIGGLNSRSSLKQLQAPQSSRVTCQSTDFATSGTAKLLRSRWQPETTTTSSSNLIDLISITEIRFFVIHQQARDCDQQYTSAANSASQDHSNALRAQKSAEELHLSRSSLRTHPSNALIGKLKHTQTPALYSRAEAISDAPRFPFRVESRGQHDERSAHTSQARNITSKSCSNRLINIPTM